jgi:hypothetical protein
MCTIVRKSSKKLSQEEYKPVRVRRQKTDERTRIYEVDGGRYYEAAGMIRIILLANQ